MYKFIFRLFSISNIFNIKLGTRSNLDFDCIPSAILKLMVVQNVRREFFCGFQKHPIHVSEFQKENDRIWLLMLFQPKSWKWPNCCYYFSKCNHKVIHFTKFQSIWTLIFRTCKNNHFRPFSSLLLEYNRKINWIIFSIVNHFPALLYCLSS